MITFSSQMKDELSRSRSDGRESELAMLSGHIKSAGSVYFAHGSAGIKLQTELANVARLVHTVFKTTLGLSPRLTTRSSSAFSKRNLYEVETDDALDALLEMGLLEANEGYSFPDDIPSAYKGEAFRYYLRGLFLGSGSVTTPEKGYHLEIVFKSEDFARQVMVHANRQYDLGVKLIARKHDHVFYIKESDKIVDFLNVVGAHQSLLAYENVRVMRYVRNNANRGVNCDTANIAKATDAARVQMDAIELLDRHGWLRRQSDKLIEIADLRKRHPFSSLTELGELLDPPVTKSGINHRMKKLLKLADELRAQIKHKEGDDATPAG